MKEISRGYIAGFFDGEGCVGGAVLSIVNTNKNLLEITSTKLKKLKIENRIRMRKKEEPHHKQAYELRVYGKQNILKFYKFIPIQHQDKIDKLEKLLNSFFYPIVTSEDIKKIKQSRREGLSYRQVAGAMNMSLDKVWRYAHSKKWRENLKLHYRTINIEQEGKDE